MATKPTCLVTAASAAHSVTGSKYDSRPWRLSDSSLPWFCTPGLSATKTWSNRPRSAVWASSM
ncbi:hypothetical protein D3C72_2590990 [compost metagenome]